jgi:hypothetical protein
MKLKHKALDEKHTQYIDQNLHKISMTKMSTNPAIMIYGLRSYLAPKDAEALTPKEWNERKHQAEHGLFNVNMFKGEDT